ncbi:hypothetical protein LGM89_24240 [Burkholderia sp. AU31624]|uniref:hypothetical protein n=1 Tax=unclassified Burkholderia TaxID=2613784 RepID=UPI000B7ACA9B|nr:MULTISPECIES: hypothetical protein [unclassified Burkholderia]MCA8064085.1 hypothetical protein [Burkholderia sp. AU38729]MCA8256385.1 hypothetical protein [Burkholderia sp. AU31624]OXI15299.1 hypothetical protein CFB43_32730 [Burkholderia sp. AU15512]
MIAMPLGGGQRERAAAAPGYIEKHGAPGHPDAFVRHRCIGWRLSPARAPYRWECVENGRPSAIG